MAPIYIQFCGMPATLTSSWLVWSLLLPLLLMPQAWPLGSVGFSFVLVSLFSFCVFVPFDLSTTIRDTQVGPVEQPPPRVSPPVRMLELRRPTSSGQALLHSQWHGHCILYLVPALRSDHGIRTCSRGSGTQQSEGGLSSVWCPECASKTTQCSGSRVHVAG